MSTGASPVVAEERSRRMRTRRFSVVSSTTARREASITRTVRSPVCRATILSDSTLRVYPAGPSVTGSPPRVLGCRAVAAPAMLLRLGTARVSSFLEVVAAADPRARSG